jgi:hypothetical protein
MKTRLGIIAVFLFFVGCATYKELQPEPPLSQAEQGYTEIRKGLEPLLLEKEGKYFMKFPKPEMEYFYVILETNAKRLAVSYFTNQFEDDGKIVGKKIDDETVPLDSTFVFRIDTSVTHFTWVIDSVPETVPLRMQYRYVPVWRYTFENKYVEYKTILADNIVDRSTYEAIDPQFSFDGFQFESEQKNLADRYVKLKAMQDELIKLESVFPVDIAAQKDTAYEQYLALRTATDNEVTFQANYREVLIFFKKEIETWGSVPEFLRAAPIFNKFFERQTAYKPQIIDKAKRVLAGRLADVYKYYNTPIMNKTDLAKIEPAPELVNAETIFSLAGVEFPKELNSLTLFVQRFNAEVEATASCDAKYRALNGMFESAADKPDAAFYASAIGKATEFKEASPANESANVPQYGKYTCSVILTEKIQAYQKFSISLLAELKALQTAATKLTEGEEDFKKAPVWPPDQFYPDLLLKMNDARFGLPKAEAVQIDQYGKCQATSWIAQQSARINKAAGDRIVQYLSAEKLVPQINAFRSRDEFREIIRLLKANQTLTFLIAQYPDIDMLSLNQQRKSIAGEIESGLWKLAESRIQELQSDKTFLTLALVASKKDQAVKQFEEQVFQNVMHASKVRVDEFAKQNELTLDNVSELYKDSVFLPIYQLSYSSGGATELIKKRKLIEDYLARMKFYQFPENSIKAIYKEFLAAMMTQGVEKARAIVEHGKFYKGNDKQVKNLVDEFNMTVPKSISKAKEYRKVFVLPVTTEKQGVNEYMFKTQLKIPTDAEFPVYDINIKLPEEIVKQAGENQWYKEITLNKKQVKNEGRVKITAPTSANDFECQISPVQMDKAGLNVLEVHFKYDGFRVFEISTMAQVPIMKKN